MSALLLTAAPTALALTLTLESTDTSSYPGITIEEYRTSSPSANVWVAKVDLCHDSVYVDATRATDTLETAGSWGADRGAQLATNGDFYRTGPLRVYGDAVGDGVQWPLDQTGLDGAYSGEWYWHNYGWIAFQHDAVTFTHTEWVKNNAAQFGGLVDGWQPTTIAPALPPGTVALVSGFPELVIEGQQYTCTSPTDATCFPDRSDMRDRNPRTAMGITADHGTFVLAVVDGRTSSSSGMYGSELADLMFQLGAYEAFNLDGGGSSEFWTEDDGYLNDVSGNNLGYGSRSIANHWGIFAGIDPTRPDRPGHCDTAAPCATIPVTGGVVDDAGTCFRTFGPQTYWRDEADGNDGLLHWTNATESDAPVNWAWWRLELDEPGSYDVQVFVDPDWGVYGEARYVVHAGGVDTELRVDQGAANGWLSLGAFPFDAGGDQWVAVFDDAPSAIPSDQHVVADAVQLVRLDPYCGDGACDPGETSTTCPVDCATTDTTDTAVPLATGDTGPGATGDDDDDDGTATDGATTDDDGDGPGPVPADGEVGCRCATGSPAGTWTAAWLGLALVGVRRRRYGL
ncbi:MAG: phosphodiester glycosidase family protein [Myxococcota bacterium]